MLSQVGVSLGGAVMFRSMVAAGAIAVTVGGGAQAQSYLSDWGIADMRQAVIAAGATVSREDNAKDPYIAATTASGLKFTITGRVCEGADGARAFGDLIESIGIPKSALG